jgi:carboxymethylenebutenolidase
LPGSRLIQNTVKGERVMETWKERTIAESAEPKAEDWVPQVNRRDFMALSVGTGVAAGFALAAQPVVAQTMVVTDTAGLTAGEVSIPAGDRNIPGYRAMPAGGKNLPTVIVVEEIFGVHEHIKDMCRRFAKKGFLAVAPELYSRLGDVTKIADIQEVLKIVNQAPDKQTLSDLDATTEWAAKNGGDGVRLGITGFCRGGRTVWLFATHSPKLKAGVAWYGPLAGNRTDAMPKTILDLAGEVKAPVLGLYGGQDQGIPLSQVDEMRAALKAKGKPGEIVVYPEAPHGFNADYRPSYRKEAAEDGMNRLLAWFKQHGAL